MRDVIKSGILRLIKFYKQISHKLDCFQKNTVQIDWFGGTDNFGDVLNPLLIHHLSGKKIVQVSSGNYYNEHYFIIGSVLARATKYTKVWGAGFISEDSHCREIPKKIYAVRGPKTRKKLLDDGIKCPEVYGDPALLLPRIYSPKIKKKYKLGIIPHYIDKKSSWLKTIVNENDVNIIDIQSENLLEFIDSVLSCEKIASSSLHGIIVADAYNIPSTWIELSNNVTGNGFKFLDYFSSVGRTDTRPFIVSNKTKTNEIMELFYNYNINIDLNKLIAAAPFEIKISPIVKD